MQFKKYEAIDMQDAIRQVKNDLGEDAVILSTNTVKRGKGIFGLFGRQIIEVTAASDRPYEDFKGEAGNKGKGDGNCKVSSKTGWNDGKAEKFPIDSIHNDIFEIKDKLGMILNLARQERTSENKSSPLSSEMNQFRGMLDSLAKCIGSKQGCEIPTWSSLWYQNMVSNGIKDIYAMEILQEMDRELDTVKSGDSGYIRAYLTNKLMDRVRVGGPINFLKGKQKIVAFVGPTGVGKTTTIGKLAAEFTLKQKKKVALLTIDTYRIAAVEQLRIYAKILGVPVDVVLSPKELKQSLDMHSEYDLIFIDTAGRSQRDKAQMDELKSFLDLNQLIEIHLVLSSTTKDDDLTEILNRFSSVPVDSMIFTKLDESSSYGSIFNSSINSKMPLSYFTMGQRVPEDIEVASKERVAELILNLSN